MHCKDARRVRASGWGSSTSGKPSASASSNWHVVTAPTKETLENYVIPTIETFLSKRGLQLSEAKTRIVQVDEGFHFLGFEIRRYKDKWLTKPQKDKVLNHLHAIKAYLSDHQQAPAGMVVKDLNPLIRGWANYYRHGTSKRTFGIADHRVWQMLWTWATRRHPKKPKKWVKDRYFAKEWTFREGQAQLLRHSATPITRHPKVIGKSSPMNPEQRDYWEQRKRNQISRQTYQKQRLAKLKAQNNACGLCGATFWPGDPIDDHHILPRNQRGDDGLNNRMLVHRWCHHAHHQRHGYKVAEA